VSKDQFQNETVGVGDDVFMVGRFVDHVRGEFERGEAERITGLPERSARRVLTDVIGLRLLASSTPKGKMSLRFPADVLEFLFPRLYPQT
jgi:hypothetical protein